MSRTEVVSLDLIIPLFNEAETLPLLFRRIRQVFRPEALVDHGIVSLHCIFVDDGSTDSSAMQIHEAIAHGFPGTLVRFSRNFGHQNAVSAGLTRSKGDIAAILDADLQDPPEVILEMVARWRQGFEVVYGVRRKRKEGWLKRFCYSAYYRLLEALSEIKVPRDSGDFSLMDQRVVRELVALPERLRFPRGLRAWVGFRQVGLEYERDRRAAGVSKYPFRELYKLGTDGIVSLSIRPLKLVQLCAFFFALFFLLCLAASLWWFLRADTRGMEIWFLLSFTLSALIGFCVLTSLFIICAYLGRMFFEIKDRPSFIIMEEVHSQTVGKRGEKALPPSPLMNPEFAI